MARGEPVWKARPRKPQPPELRDPRAEAVVRGVANRAARRVHDVEVAALRALRQAGRGEALGDGLLDACRLGLWEVRRVVGFEAFAEDVVGVPVAEARNLVAEAATRAGCSAEPIPPYARAVVLRARASLLEAAEQAGETAAPDARVMARGDGESLRVVVDVAGPKAAAALAAIGRVLWPLAEDLAQSARPAPPRDRRPRRP